MSEKELLYQVLNREVNNIINAINPAFRIFSNTITNYIINFIDPYLNLFTNDDGFINTKAAEGYLKQEVNEKIEKFMKDFESKNGREGSL